jgi:putative transposase
MLYRKQLRLNTYDYSQPGDYFVTICTRNLVEYFGRVLNEQVEFSRVGEIAERCWRGIPNHFTNVWLDKHIVMPNHVHGIIKIKHSLVVKRHAFSLRRNAQLLPVIIGSFKSAVTKYVNLKIPNNHFSWQTSYYDRIIETDEELDNIREYIELNPFNWEQDIENEECRRKLPKGDLMKSRGKYYKKLFKIKKD